MTGSDIVYYKSLNTDGGAIDTSSPITSGQNNNLFPDVDATTAENGGEVFRKFFTKNTHATDTALNSDICMTRFSDAGDYMMMFVGTDTDSLGDITENLGTGDDAAVTFSGTLTTTPIRPYTVKVVADTVTATDDGSGNLKGTGVTSGTVDYSTGAISITFDTAPANAVSVDVYYRDTTDKLYGICKANAELDRGTKVVTVDTEGGQALSDGFAAGDRITFIDSSTGQKIVAATIAVGGVDDATPALTINEDIPAATVLNGAYIANTYAAGGISAAGTIPIWLRQVVPPFTSAFSNSYVGVTHIFVSS